MGNTCCGKRNEKKIISLLLIGLDNAGKTVAAKGLAGEPLEDVVPTVGVSLINLKYRNFHVKVFDLGGGPSIRGIWHRYFVCAHGVIFVVDSSDYNRIDEARKVLMQVLTHEKVSGKPLLVLANKQDHGEALDEVDLVEGLDLETLVNRCKCPTLVETCCAERIKVDPGIKKGYNWLLNFIIRDYDYFNERVKKDLKQQDICDQFEWLKKLERVKNSSDNREREDDDRIESLSEYDRKIQNGEVKTIEKCDSYKEDNVTVVQYEEIRSKSAIHLVKQQLQLNMENKSYLSRNKNKTNPANFYAFNRSQSVKERRRLDVARRKLKSAGEQPNNKLDFPDTSTNIESLHQELFVLKETVKKPIQVRPKSTNSASITWSES